MYSMIRKGSELFRADLLGILIGAIFESSSDFRLAVILLSIVRKQVSISTHLSNKVASMGQSGVDASSRVFSVTSPPALHVC